jgi:AcrR family transcriptional regulator
MTADETGLKTVRSTADEEHVERPTPRRTLDRITILREAVRFIDEYGREQLTMRRLGAELGVEAMALYRYVPGREQLLDGVVETVMDELYRNTMTKDYALTWQEYLQRMAHGVEDIAIVHPKIFPLVASRPPAAPWLRPPLRSLRWVESFLQGLAHYGFDMQSCVVIYRAFSTFLLGHLLLQVATTGHEPLISAQDDIEFFESNDLSNYPLVLELSTPLSQDTHGVEFEDALEDLINRLETLLH